MKIDDLIPLIRGVPYLSPDQGRALYRHVREARPEHCLELGFAHGASSCYIAAALAANGRGRLTTVDLVETKDHFRPSIDDLLDRTGLRSWVDVRREPTSYTWFLKRVIEERSSAGACEPLYDFCFIDGAKNWTIDGFAFLLVDKLLREGGFVLFDDLKWTYRQSQAEYGTEVTDGIVIRKLSQEERDVPHIDLVFRLLVMQHPGYGRFRIEDDNWAWAQKLRAGPRTLDVVTTRLSWLTMLYRLLRPLRRRLGISKS